MLYQILNLHLTQSCNNNMIFMFKFFETKVFSKMTYFQIWSSLCFPFSCLLSLYLLPGLLEANLLFPNKHFFLWRNSWLGTCTFTCLHLGMGTSWHSVQVICLQSLLDTVLQSVVFLTEHVKELEDLSVVLGWGS